MAEISQADLESKIADIDAAIAAGVAALTSGTGAAAWVDYTMGDMSISASQKLTQLRELREMYQKMLTAFPKEISNVVGYDVDRDGRDRSEQDGDQ